MGDYWRFYGMMITLGTYAMLLPHEKGAEHEEGDEVGVGEVAAAVGVRRVRVRISDLVRPRVALRPRQTRQHDVLPRLPRCRTEK